MGTSIPCCTRSKVKKEATVEVLDRNEIEKGNESELKYNVYVTEANVKCDMKEKTNEPIGGLTMMDSTCAKSLNKSIVSNSPRFIHRENIIHRNGRIGSFYNMHTFRLALANNKAYRMLPKTSAKNLSPNVSIDSFSTYHQTESFKTPPQASFNVLPLLLLSQGELTPSSLTPKMTRHSPFTPNNNLNPKLIINTPFTVKQRKEIKNILFHEELLHQEMDDDTINAIIKCIYYLRVLSDVILYTKNSNDNIYYMIERGKLEYSLDGEVSVRGKHNGIGTKALEKNSEKECYLKSIEKTYLFCLPIDQYKQIFCDFLEKEKAERANAMKSIPLFKNLDQRLLLMITNSLVKTRYTAKKIIIKEEEVSRKVWYILTGNVSLSKNGSFIKRLEPENIFGELPLLHQVGSLYTYTAENELCLYEIQHETLINILGRDYSNKIISALFFNSLKKSHMFSTRFHAESFETLFTAFHLKYYVNENVYTSKEKKLLIPVTGQLYQQKSGEYRSPVNISSIIWPETQVGNIGILYGESFIDSTETLDFNVFTDECLVFESLWTDILRTLKCISDQTLSIYEKVQAIKNHQMFRNVSDFKLMQLAEALKTVKFKDNEIIIPDGPISSRFYIIRKGSVKVLINGREVKTLECGKSFGDIISKKEDYTKTASFLAKGKIQCYCLEKEDFEEIMKCALFKPLKKILTLKDLTLTLEDLYYIRELGKGSYGKVYLVHDDKRLFALKTAEISFMFKNKLLTQFYLNEKTIMYSIDHPFIVKLINTFKTNEFIFFLLEYVDGPTLESFFESKSQESFRNLNEVLFYGGILLTVLHYLSKKRIIHRDLKPGNCMINSNGYLKVIDFGVAKDMGSLDHTNTFIGTPQYMSPEVILAKGYGFSTDYWSVGVILYELFYGKVPFGADAEDPMEVYRQITDKSEKYIKSIRKLSLITDPKYKECNNLLKQLLYKNPNKRLNSLSKAKNHIFFNKFDFDQLLEQKLVPPFIPKSTVSFEDEVRHSLARMTTFIKNICGPKCGANKIENLKSTSQSNQLDKF